MSRPHSQIPCHQMDTENLGVETNQERQQKTQQDLKKDEWTIQEQWQVNSRGDWHH